MFTTTVQEESSMPSVEGQDNQPLLELLSKAAGMRGNEHHYALEMKLDRAETVLPNSI